MVKSGYISFIQITTAGSFDEERNPIAPKTTPTAFIPCNLKTITKEYRTLVDQQYLQASYSCYIENDLLTALNLLVGMSSVTSIELRDSYANDLGVFQVHNIEYLKISKKTKIIV